MQQISHFRKAPGDKRSLLAGQEKNEQKFFKKKVMRPEQKIGEPYRDFVAQPFTLSNDDFVRLCSVFELVPPFAHNKSTCQTFCLNMDEEERQVAKNSISRIADESLLELEQTTDPAVRAQME